MIKIESRIGTFTITDSQLSGGDMYVEAFFNIAVSTVIRVDEGPRDYAIAKRMVDMIGGPWKNLEQNTPGEELN